MDKMDYLQGLGVEALYFNPLFVSPSNHKYDIQDYEAVRRNICARRIVVFILIYPFPIQPFIERAAMVEPVF